MSDRKIVIKACTECPHMWHGGGFGSIMYKPYCKSVSDNLPFTTSVQRGSVVATPTGVIPEWCPLEKNDE